MTVRPLTVAALAAALAAAMPSAAQSTMPLLAPDDSIVDGAKEQAPRLSFTVAERAVPAQLSPQQRYRYMRIFLDIDSGRLSNASAALQGMARGPLHPVAEAQILERQGANAGLTRLLEWLQANPAAPQAPQIAALARMAGATNLPSLAARKRLMPVSLTPPLSPRSAPLGGTSDQRFAASAQAMIDANKAADVATLIASAPADLSSEVKSEWAQRAAWDSYLDLDDLTARRLGEQAASGSGEWAAMGNWVAGLASFRQNDCEAAARHFDQIGQQYVASNDLRAAGAYWAARAHVRCGRPHMASERLRSATARDRSGFYGLLATRTLGLTHNFDWSEPDFIQADWTTLKSHPGAQRAAALVEIGQLGLADRELRHLAATTSNSLYEPTLRLAARLDLPATQYWLAQNPPPGMMPPMSAQLPRPEWKPFNGWRVDRNLVFAHALQESKFITDARSGPGAKGAMQLMPGTARDLARAYSMEHREDLLSDPSFNVEYGQAYLEQLRDSPHTNGLLPKVIAAYNAGPGSVQKWNGGGVRDNGDVLLYIESIPFRETRHYVEVVMRNYWLYELKDSAARGQASHDSQSLTTVAANSWPRFPGRQVTASR